tara:strand:+ start:182 stop:424 length:243 start_codon:yes stop_codon:yes gene_type:complete
MTCNSNLAHLSIPITNASNNRKQNKLIHYTFEDNKKDGKETARAIYFTQKTIQSFILYSIFFTEIYKNPKYIKQFNKYKI